VAGIAPVTLRFFPLFRIADETAGRLPSRGKRYPFVMLAAALTHKL